MRVLKVMLAVAALLGSTAALAGDIPPFVVVPTLGLWGLGALAAALVVLAVRFLRRDR